MKFDCGANYDEWEAKMLDWHPHFCWWPVMIASHDCRWLEPIERKFRFIGQYTGKPRRPSYRLPATPNT